MTPGARIQAVIELLDRIADSETPADHLVNKYFRIRRYAGSKDRRAISDMVYDILRNRSELAWRAGARKSRTLALAHLSLAHKENNTIGEFFDGGQFSPSPLQTHEWSGLDRMRSPVGNPPLWISGNYPKWLHKTLQRRFGKNLTLEMAALRKRAPVDLRINQIKSNLAEVTATLAADGIPFTPGRYIPTALRLKDRRLITTHKLYRSGSIEIQDEGSQLVAQLCAVKPGHQLIDFCAGAGGKSLALASAMENKGQIFAFDTSRRRLRPLRDRLRRADARNIQVHVLSDAVARALLDERAGKMDRVLVDVPCSGSGAWRRNPESKWRLTAKQLSEYTRRQSVILDRAAALVAPCGMLIYATCSILIEENEDRINAFLSEHNDFELLPITDVWKNVIESPCPTDEPYLQLTPAKNSTDGFFVAILMRKKFSKHSKKSEVKFRTATNLTT